YGDTFAGMFGPPYGDTFAGMFGPPYGETPVGTLAVGVFILGNVFNGLTAAGVFIPLGLTWVLFLTDMGFGFESIDFLLFLCFSNISYAFTQILLLRNCFN